MSGSRRHNIAFVEEADDDAGSSIEGVPNTRVYAYSEAPSTPTKELPNTGKSRRGDNSASSSDSRYRSSRKEKEEARRARDARDAREARRLKEQEREERDAEARKARAAAKAAKETSKALRKTRPQPPRHAATQPVIQQTPPYRRGQYDDPSHYGIPQPAVSGNRPRANTRPASYYAGQTQGGPPPTPSWQPSPMVPSPYGPVGSYSGPPPMYGGPPMHAIHGGPPPPSPTGPPRGYFDPGPVPPQHPPHDMLKQRFERPASAMGHRSSSSRSYASEVHYDYDDEPPYVSKRSSRSKKQEDDRKRMPPPQFKPASREVRDMRDMPRRPSTTAPPQTTPFQPPPRPESRHGHSRPPHGGHRRSVGFVDHPTFDDDDLLDENDLFHDLSPQPPYPQRRKSMARTRRESLVYDDDEYEITPAGRGSRRDSIYGGAELGSGGASLESENKYMDALRYQEDVSGGAPVPLTAETLRKANKRGERVASSRSTRSSGSRDESEYKRSNTTGITRSSSGGDDFTIKVSGPAVVRVNGAEIECEDSEITFSNGGPGGSRSGSDHVSTMYQLEDRSHHRERKALPHRTRAPSQSDSQSRGYAPSHAPYEPYGGSFF